MTSIALNLDKKSYYVEKFIEFLNNNYRHDMGSTIKKRKKNKRNFFINLFMKCASRIKIFLVRNDIYLSFIPKKYYIDKNIKEKKFKSLSLVEMKSYIKILQKINKDNKKIKIKKISESAFLMSK